MTALVERAEGLGWSCCVDPEDGSIEFSQDSPCGENFSFRVNGDTVDEIVENIRKYADEFDADLHIDMWMNAKKSGVSGVPSFQELAEDANAIQNMLNVLARDIAGHTSKIVLRSKIEEAKAEYQKLYGKLDWQWTDEGLPWTIQAYQSSVGSVMEFTEDDWRACKENGWTLDEVCRLCNERHFCEDVDNLERYIQAVRENDREAGIDHEFVELSEHDAIAYVKNFYIWREKLLAVVKEVYSNS